MFLHIVHFIGIALQVLLIFNVIIIVHELGHFLAAKWRGLYVEEFAVWFGKPIWRKKFGGVWYALNSIPAGGYVKLPQMAPMDSIEGQSEIPLEQLKPIKPLDKIIVAFAGPLFSFLLALALATVVWQIGKPVSDSDETTVIGYVAPDGPADKAGLKVGDKILAIDGKKVERFGGTSRSVTWNIISSEGQKIRFKIERDGKVMDIYSGWRKEDVSGWSRPSLRQVLIGPRRTPWVYMVEPKSLAGKAGLEHNDLIEPVNGEPVQDWVQIEDIILGSRGKALTFGVDRHGSKVEVKMDIPASDPANPEAPIKLGIAQGKLTLAHPLPWDQVEDSVQTIFNMVGALTSSGGDVKAAHFSGPVGIMNLYRRLFELPDGWRLAIWFSVFFNVNLALLNMLPLPVLDGGHITFAIIESIRRKPVTGKWIEVVNTGSALLLIGFMLYVTFFDLGDLFRRDKPEPKAEKPVPVEKSE